MPNGTQTTTPRQYQGVMVSSTFTDLEQHRAVLMEALRKEELFAIGMEEYVPIPGDDVISSSLNMVRKGSAYIGLISHRYGQTPVCLTRNSLEHSVTRLEFDEAQRLGLPTLIFVMGDEHPVKKSDVETNLEKIKKLDEFRERGKAGRIYSVFNNLDDFTSKAIHAAAALRRYLDEKGERTEPSKAPAVLTTTPADAKPDPIPTPPAFYAEPPYIGSHKFVGRQAQLDTLSDWANSADSHSVLLFEAIGGTGKSMLTWEWTTKRSSSVRDDWAGQFWYSFYEKGATMLDFCRRALVYMTRQPRSYFKEKNTAELTELLIHQLQAKPWLFVLDGLERVLVSYHRIDAAHLRDEEAGITDKIAHRDPCAAINPEDDDLLRALAGARPSKLLITSRLIPRVLLNKSNQPIPGVLREHLPGLRPVDAEALIRTCGITGDSLSIQSYLKTHCDCHPLVVGVLAGLINDYLPDRGNFDSWSADPSGGGQLNLANLDLVQKRNHILNAALAALPEASRQLLSTLALLSETVDYQTLCALNPQLPPIPEEVPRPKKMKQDAAWRKLTEVEQKKAHEEYLDAVKRREEYERERAPAKREEEIRLAAPALAVVVKDLERRGLLQYDATSKRYDLHPVVRGISAGGLKNEEKNRYGRRVVDHFSQQAQDPYDQAETLDEFDNARHIVKVLFQMGKEEEAHKFIVKNNTFIQVLNSRFEAHNEILTIIRPFFADGWGVMPAYLAKKGGVSLAKRAAVCLRRINALQDAFDVSETALHVILEQNIARNLCSHLLNIASTVGEQNHLALEDRLLGFAGDIVKLTGTEKDSESYLLARFRQLSKLGRWDDAITIFQQLSDDKLLPDSRAISRHHYVVHLYQRGKLTSEELTNAEKESRLTKSALGIRNLCALRGFWLLERGELALAKKSLQEAVTLAHRAGKVDRRAEICLATAKHDLQELVEPNHIAEQFVYDLEETCQYALANLWFSIGAKEKAKDHAISAYKWAWADGEPFVRRSELIKIRALLVKLDVDPPVLPAYDPTKDERYPWENDVAKIIEKLRAIYRC
jgi:pentatricopeptide repeat protein